MKRYEVTNDYIFKKIFGKEGNEEILKDLLISILEIPIKEIEVIHDSHLERTIEANKAGILDIKATLNNNITINIEMQVKDQYNMIDRSLYYWANLYSNGLYKREDYTENNKTIVINILAFNIFEDGPYHEKCMIKRDYNGETLTEDLEMHFIQIPKAEKEKIRTTLDLWIRFIGNVKDEEVEKMKNEVNEETKKAVMEAQEQYWKIMADPETRRIAELREKAIRDEVTNLNGAKREGKKERSIEIANKMKEMNMKIEDIEKATGLTKEEIERL